MRPSADVWLTYFFHSESTVVSGKSPITNFSHTNAIDDLIEAAKEETNKEKQIQLWKKAQYKLLEDAINYPMYILRFVFARSPKVKWGYDLKTTLALYPQINELTSNPK
jgi:peptide/nickel transport system substrate-binding protein